MKKIISKPKVTTGGLMNGDWQVMITGIKDEDLETVEILVLEMFGMKKKKDNGKSTD